MTKNNFQQKVFEIVSKVPKGKILSYKQVAKQLGNSKLARAVGRALAKNTNPRKIPCYRVICSDGSIGGYRWGIKKKILLLKEEGIFVKKIGEQHKAAQRHYLK